MKQTIIRLFSLLLLGMVAEGAQAGATYYKNIHVTMDVPVAEGTVYLKVNSGSEQEQTCQTDVNGHADFKATISEQDDKYSCNLYADPAQGKDFVGFYKKKSSGTYTDADLIGKINPYKVNVDAENMTKSENYDELRQSSWNENPDAEFVAIFKNQDTSVENFSVVYYQPLLSGKQDETFGTWNSELIDGGANVKLTANPAAGMRFVCWRNGIDEEIDKKKEMTVKNINFSYKAEFNLAPLTLPAELSTYSNTKQSRFDDEKSGLTAYKVTAVSDKLTLVKIRHAEPGEGVILQGEAGKEYEMSYQGLFGLDSNHPEDNHSDNLLKGTASGPVQTNGKIYVLANKKQGLGFYKLADNEEVPQGKAYLEIDDANNARDFFGFDDGTTTSISSVAEVEQPTPIYNMAGQRVSGSFSGLVIQNGRKYIRK